MKINFFDIGMCSGQSTDFFIEIINDLKIKKYTVYGFEPYYKNYIECTKKYKKNSKIKVLNLAISNENKKEKIYTSKIKRGHSLFCDKNNIININQYQKVSGIKFSDWFLKNINKFDFNIIHVNIEGAEYYFFNDVIDNKTYKFINLFFGEFKDLKKVESLKKEYEPLKKKIEQHGIKVLNIKKSIKILKNSLTIKIFN